MIKPIFNKTELSSTVYDALEEKTEGIPQWSSG